jgi:hypothetical protein
MQFLLASEFRALVKGEPESIAAELDLDGDHQANGDSVERKRIPQDTLQVSFNTQPGALSVCLSKGNRIDADAFPWSVCGLL